MTDVYARVLTVLACSAILGCGAAAQYETVRPDVVRGGVLTLELAQCADAAIKRWHDSTAQAAVAALATAAPVPVAPVAPPTAPTAP